MLLISCVLHYGSLPKVIMDGISRAISGLSTAFIGKFIVVLAIGHGADLFNAMIMCYALDFDSHAFGRYSDGLLVSILSIVFLLISL